MISNSIVTEIQHIFVCVDKIGSNHESSKFYLAFETFCGQIRNTSKSLQSSFFFIIKRKRVVKTLIKTNDQQPNKCHLKFKIEKEEKLHGLTIMKYFLGKVWL